MSTEQKDTEQKDTEQKAIGQKAIGQKDTGQKAAEQEKAESSRDGVSVKKLNKITPIRFPYDTSDDPEIDDFLLESLQKEADETERRMNADPDFAKTDAPVGQYEKIVASLKEMGEWEEEEEGDTEIKTEAEAVTEPEMRSESEPGPESEMSFESEPEFKPEATAGSKDAYFLLSDKDRQALELGRMEQRRQERKRARSERLQRVAKRGGTVAAAFVLLLVVSMNVEASRRVILRMWDSVADVLATRTATNNMEDSLQSTMAESLAAMAEIEEATGIPGLDFAYWPAGMRYLQYEVQDGNADAYVFYSYGEGIFQLYMRNAPEDSANYLVTDQETAFVETAESWTGTEVKIWSVNPGSGAEQYQAEFEHGNFRYVFYGYISLEELERLINGLDFLS